MKKELFMKKITILMLGASIAIGFSSDLQSSMSPDLKKGLSPEKIKEIETYIAQVHKDFERQEAEIKKAEAMSKKTINPYGMPISEAEIKNIEENNETNRQDRQKRLNQQLQKTIWEMMGLNYLQIAEEERKISMLEYEARIKNEKQEAEKKAQEEKDAQEQYRLSRLTPQQIAQEKFDKKQEEERARIGEEQMKKRQLEKAANEKDKAEIRARETPKQKNEREQREANAIKSQEDLIQQKLKETEKERQQEQTANLERLLNKK